MDLMQVGDRMIRNRTAEVSDFAEFFQTEAIKGTTIKILPSMMETPEVGVVMINNIMYNIFWLSFTGCISVISSHCPRPGHRPPAGHLANRAC